MRTRDQKYHGRFGFGIRKLDILVVLCCDFHIFRINVFELYFIMLEFNLLNRKPVLLCNRLNGCLINNVYVFKGEFG